jgi:hypothetical protein
MDAGVILGNSAWQGFVSGGSLALSLGLFSLPISIVTNAYIHHKWPLRLLMGILGAMGSVFVIIYSLFFMRGRHYYGLIPLTTFDMPASPQGTTDWLVWLFTMIGSLHLILASPFLQNQDLEDISALNDHMAVIYGKEGPFVNEALYERAREIATKSDGVQWAAALAVSDVPVQ